MKKYFVTIILALVILLGIAGIAYASDVTGAKWYGTVRITNNSTATSAVSANFSLDTAEMISNNQLNATATNVAILTDAAVDTAFMPSVNSSYPWMVFVPSIGLNQSLDYTLYTDNVTGGKIRYFPGAAGMTVPDDATLEPGDNFTITVSGFLDATGIGSFVRKGLSFAVEGDGSGNITAAAGWGNLLMPDYTEVDANNKLTVTPSRTIASQVDSDEDVYYYKDFGTDYFNSVDIRFTIQIDSSSDGDSRYGIAVANSVGTIEDFAATDISVVGYYTGGARIYLARGVWAATDFGGVAADTPYYCRLVKNAGANSANVYIYSDADMTVLVDTLTVSGYGAGTHYRYLYGAINRNNAIGGRNFDGYVEVNAALVSASGVTSGEYDIEAGANSSNLTISKDSILQNSIALSRAIFDTSENWTFAQSAVMPYMEYAEITVGGVQKGYWDWEYATTFTDSSGNGNTATPTFPTTSSDADVSADLITFLPVTQSQHAEYSVGDYSSMVTAPSNIPEMYQELTPTLPGHDIIDDIATAGNVPSALAWFPLILVAICIIGFLIYKFTDSLLMMCIVMATLAGFFSITGVIPFWITPIFGIQAVALIMGQKQFGW